MFELAVLELKEAEVRDKGEGERVDVDVRDEEEGKASREMWEQALKNAEKKLDAAGALVGAGGVDLSARLESRIEMLRDEIQVKRRMIGV